LPFNFYLRFMKRMRSVHAVVPALKSVGIAWRLTWGGQLRTGGTSRSGGNGQSLRRPGSRSIVPASIPLRHNGKPTIAQTFGAGARGRRGALLRARDIVSATWTISIIPPGLGRAARDTRIAMAAATSTFRQRPTVTGATARPSRCSARFRHARRKQPCMRDACAHGAERAVMILR
jgi:hypothetical protein